jgi:hypothetical protein
MSALPEVEKLLSQMNRVIKGRGVRRAICDSTLKLK